MNGFDEDFNEDLDDGQPRNTLAAYGATTNDSVNHSLITPEMGKKHVMEKEYMNHELDYGDEDDN